MGRTPKTLKEWPTAQCAACGWTFSTVGPRPNRDPKLCNACNQPRMWGDDENDGRAFARAVIDAFEEE